MQGRKTTHFPKIVEQILQIEFSSYQSALFGIHLTWILWRNHSWKCSGIIFKQSELIVNLII